ncbi:centriolin-like [Seriola aureovittata]|uniref:centriolin-like n=1 Tax=Seriola aureovittata TaxID=2871759 RepID=UPI0024BE8DFF|nr:centriolin-like [Seriola aureovittata]
MEEQREVEGGADSQDNRGGIRYITEELLLKLTGCRSLALVRSLNLSSSPADKHIKFIENLHVCQRLQVLNLNHNMIQRMEKLNALSQLRELQLAHNHIQRIEGLEHLSSLQHLNLSHNRIDHVPLWLGKKLQSLHTLHLQHNLITSVSGQAGRPASHSGGERTRPPALQRRGAGASAAGGGQQPIRAEQAAEGAAGCSDSTPPAGGDEPDTDGSDTNTTTHTHTAGARATHQDAAVGEDDSRVDQSLSQTV